MMRVMFVQTCLFGSSFWRIRSSIEWRNLQGFGNFVTKLCEINLEGFLGTRHIIEWRNLQGFGNFVTELCEINLEGFLVVTFKVVEFFMQLLNIFSRLQWAVFLFLCVAFIPTTVYAEAPKASFYADTYNGLAPLFVLVNAEQSSPWEGTDRIARFEWSTSDGTVIKNQLRVGLPLSALGTQTITLKVWNEAGESHSTTKIFEVCNEYGAKCPSPPLPPLPPLPSSNGSTGSTVSFKVDRIEKLTVHLKASGMKTGIAHEYRVRLKTDISMSSYYFNSEKFSIKLPKAGTYIISLYIPKKDDSGWNQLQAETVAVYEPTPMY